MKRTSATRGVLLLNPTLKV